MAAVDLHSLAENYLLLTGSPRVGKSSIKAVVYENIAPHLSQLLEPTIELTENKFSIQSICDYSVVEVPYHMMADVENNKEVMEKLFTYAKVAVHVYDHFVDNQEEEQEFMCQVTRFASRCMQSFKMYFLLNKIDPGLMSYSETIDLIDNMKCLLIERIPRMSKKDRAANFPSFRTVSIFDNSIRLAISEVLEEFIHCKEFITSLCDKLAQKCGAKRVFLLDANNGVIYGRDRPDLEVLAYDLCLDILDMKNILKTFTDSTDGSIDLQLQSGFNLQLHQITTGLCVAMVLPKEIVRELLVLYNLNLFTELLLDGLDRMHKFEVDRPSDLPNSEPICDDRKPVPG